jgi:hypothetical protein
MGHIPEGIHLEALVEVSDDDCSFTMRFDPPLVDGQIRLPWPVRARDPHPINSDPGRRRHSGLGNPSQRQSGARPVNDAHPILPTDAAGSSAERSQLWARLTSLRRIVAYRSVPSLAGLVLETASLLLRNNTADVLVGTVGAAAGHHLALTRPDLILSRAQFLAWLSPRGHHAGVTHDPKLCVGEREDWSLPCFRRPNGY